MAIGDVYQLVRQVYVDGNAHFNVLHFIQDVSMPNGPEQTLIDLWDDTNPPAGIDAPEARMFVMMRGGSAVTRSKITIQKISPDKGEVFEYGFQPRTPPSLTAGLPTFCSVLYAIATTLNSRSGKGGLHVGAIAETDTTNNVLTTGYGTSYGTPFVNSLLGYFTPSGAGYAGFTIGIWSRLLQQFNPVQSISYNTVIGSQNSRKQGRGI